MEFVVEAQRGTHGEIHREQSAAAIDIVDGKARRRGHGRVDYLLRMHVPPHVQPLTLAFIEAKKEALHPGAGIEQVKEYAEVAKRQNVQFVFSTNGHLFVEYDRGTGQTSDPRPIVEFPAPLQLRVRYEQALGIDLSAPGAQALFSPYATAGDTPRYYQDAAIRAVLERLALAALGKAPGRALLSLATGAGKTIIAVQLVKRLFDAGQAIRVLFVCDRDELRKQALGKFHNVFGDDAKLAFETADGSNNAHNARVHIATYQTLGVDGEEADDGEPPSESFLSRHYPPNHFSHIIIDECHRSAWGRWSEVLRRNSDAMQIGLTATPRKIQWPKGAHTAEAAKKDEAITADNIRHFGEPVYEYTLTQGIEDGYLAPCEIKQGRVSIDDQIIKGSDVLSHKAKNARTGHAARQDEVRNEYTRLNYDRELQIPERLSVICRDLFDYLVDSGGPEQKTIVFCTSDANAQRVAAQLGNLYAQWCEAEQRARAANFAFQCTATTEGGALVADLRGSTTSHFIATTVDLLSTGVDVPCVRNIVFFRYLESPILFYQMVGRGTRIDEDTGKLMFRLYDYTNMIRLFGADFITRLTKPRQRGGGDGDDDDPPPILVADGFAVKVDRGGHFVLGEADGKVRPIPIDEYKAKLAEQLKHEAADLAQFRAQWIVPEARHGLLDHLVQGGYSPRVLQLVDVMQDYDLFDVLARVAYASKARKRLDRMLAFQYRHEDWLGAMPEPARRVILGVAHQFERDGTEGLENRELWNVPEIVKAGGLKALRKLGKAADVLRDAKQRLFSV